MRMLSVLIGFGLIGLMAPAAAVAQDRGTAVEHAYGKAAGQALDFYPAAPGLEPPPLVIFVHGGGWSRGDKGNATGPAKITHFRAQGYAFASINYRLVPAATVEQQAADVADAVAWLIAHSGTLRFDPKRVVLMGHSAGAHLSALVATDPRYLAKAGSGVDRLRGVVLLDGAAYDVPAQMAEAGRFMRGRYRAAFGDDAARQRTLSPSAHAAAPNAPAFLILHVDREDGARQSQALGAGLKAAGANVVVQGFEGRGLRGHVAMNRQLGEADYPATAVVDRWLTATFAPR